MSYICRDSLSHIANNHSGRDCDQDRTFLMDNLTEIKAVESTSELTTRILKASIIFLIMCLILVSNTAILSVVISSKAHRCAQGILLASLACCDLLVGLLIAPFSFVASVTDTWTQGNTWCTVSGNTLCVLTMATCLHITAISLDKYLKTAFPYKYHHYNDQSPAIASVVVVVIWTTCCLSIVIPSVIFPGSYIFWQQSMLCLTTRWENIIFSSSILGMALCINCGLNIKLMLVARRTSRSVPHVCNIQNIHEVRKQDVKGIRTVLMINLSFTLSYLPGVLAFVYTYLYGSPLGPHLAFLIAWLLIASNFFNMIVYYKSNANFRKAFKGTMFPIYNTLKKDCRCCRNPRVRDMPNSVSITLEVF